MSTVAGGDRRDGRRLVPGSSSGGCPRQRRSGRSRATATRVPTTPGGRRIRPGVPMNGARMKPSRGRATPVRPPMKMGSGPEAGRRTPACPAPGHRAATTRCRSRRAAASPRPGAAPPRPRSAPLRRGHAVVNLGVVAGVDRVSGPGGESLGDGVGRAVDLRSADRSASSRSRAASARAATPAPCSAGGAAARPRAGTGPGPRRPGLGDHGGARRPPRRPGGGPARRSPAAAADIVADVATPGGRDVLTREAGRVLAHAQGHGALQLAAAVAVEQPPRRCSTQAVAANVRQSRPTWRVRSTPPSYRRCSGRRGTGRRAAEPADHSAGEPADTLAAHGGGLGVQQILMDVDLLDVDRGRSRRRPSTACRRLGRAAGPCRRRAAGRTGRRTSRRATSSCRIRWARTRR